MRLPTHPGAFSRRLRSIPLLHHVQPRATPCPCVSPDPLVLLRTPLEVFVLGTLFYATFLNYFDRQILGVALEPISQEFNLDLGDRGRLLAAFVYVYAFSHLFIGFLIDRVNNLRWLFAAMLLGWSLVTFKMGFARGYHDLLVLRMVLGVFECINFPLCLLIISRIFPKEQRALASGIFVSGAVIATLIAPKIVIWLSAEMHWRWAFFVAGGLGLTWLVPWLAIFRHPERRSTGWAIAVAEQANIATAGERTLGSILGRSSFWAIAS